MISVRPNNVNTAKLRPGMRAWHYAPILLPLMLLIGTGLRGLDFGLHWDERPWQIGPVKHMVQRTTPLPGYYDYPSFDYWLNLLVLSPDIFSSRAGENLREHLIQVLNSHAYLLRLRVVYLVITSLSLLWVYLLVLQRRRSWVEALFAASLLGFSWEVAYHLRWVATDGMLMQFAAVTVLLAIHALTVRNNFWLIGAAVGAGLGFATKYPGGLLVLPVVLAAFFTGKTFGEKVVGVVKVATVFALVYLAVTPATIVQPVKLANAVLYEMQHYARGHGGHSVGRGLAHAYQMITYFATVLWSPYLHIAVLMFALTVVGIIRMAAQDSREGAVFLAFPLFYLLYFSTQGTMVVRNLLAVSPFLAVATARGASLVAEFGNREAKARVLYVTWYHLVWAGLLCAALCLNASWLITSAESIRTRHSDRFIRETCNYIRAHSSAKFLLSPRVKSDLTEVGLPLENVTTDPAVASAVVLYAREGMRRWHDWPANRRDLTEECFGPREVNFNMYPGWWGEDHIVVISRQRAHQIDLHIAGISKDTPLACEEANLRPPTATKTATTPPSSESLPGSWASNGMATYVLPPIDPRVLVSQSEGETITAASIRGPATGGWDIDGIACSFFGPHDLIVSIAIISTNAFALEQYDPQSTSASGVGLLAYVAREGPLGDVRLFARTINSAVVVTVSGHRSDPEARLSLAKQFAAKALSKLDAVGESRMLHGPPRYPAAVSSR